MSIILYKVILYVFFQQPVDDYDSQLDTLKKIKWKELTPIPVCRSGHTAVLLGGFVYVGSGFEGTSSYNRKNSYRLDMYDLTANQWTSPPITTPYSHFAMTVLDDKLVTAGGATKNETVKKVLVFDAGEWKDYSEMPTARCDATAVGYRSMLVVVGGGAKVRDEWIRISTTEVLDTTNRCWYTCSNLPSPRQQLKAVTINNKLYLSGGIDKSGKESLQVFVTTLDILPTYKLLNWQSAPNTPWCASAPVVLCNKFLVTVGGRQRNRTAE